jgi:site-specific recombinase XerD
MQNQPRKLLDQVRDAIRTKHYAYRTERSYVDWIKRYVLFHKKRHPAEMGAPEVQAFITFLAVDRQLSASTQNQALSAILFLYKYVLQKDFALPLNLVRAERPSPLPTVLTMALAVCLSRVSALPRPALGSH